MTPFDGLEYGDTVASASVTLSDLDPSPLLDPMILPDNPTSADPLYAEFTYSGRGAVDVEWYVDDVLAPEASCSRFYRFSLQPNQNVRFEARVSYSSQEYAISPTVTIAAAPMRVINLRVDGQMGHRDVASLTPVITWDALVPPNTSQQVAHISIGTAYDQSDILNTTLSLAATSYTVPAGLLRAGTAYFLAVSIGEGPATSTSFRVTGSLWEQQVDNTTGWTLEVVAKVDADYQGLRISDGTKFAELRLYQQSIMLLSQRTTTTVCDLTYFRTLTVVGQGSNIEVYVDRSLVLDGTGLLVQSASDKYLELGAIGPAGQAEFQSARYAITGAYHPGTDTALSEYVFESILELPRHSVSSLTHESGKVLLGVTTPDATTLFYEYDHARGSQSSNTASKTFQSHQPHPCVT